MAILSSVNRSTHISHIFIFPLAKALEYMVCHNSIRNITSNCFIFYAISTALRQFVYDMPDNRNLHYAAHEDLVELRTKTSTYGSLSFAVFPEDLEQFTVDHMQPFVVRGTN